MHDSSVQYSTCTHMHIHMYIYDTEWAWWNPSYTFKCKENYACTTIPYTRAHTHMHTRTHTHAQKSLCVITYQHQVTISGENTSEANYRKGIRLLSPESWCDHCQWENYPIRSVAADGMSGKPILAQLEPCLPIFSCKWQYIVMLQCWQYTVFTHFTQVSNTWELVQSCSCDRVTLLVSGNSRWNVWQPHTKPLGGLVQATIFMQKTTNHNQPHMSHSRMQQQLVRQWPCSQCAHSGHMKTSFLYLFTIKNSIVTYWKLLHCSVRANPMHTSLPSLHFLLSLFSSPAPAQVWTLHHIT